MSVAEQHIEEPRSRLGTPVWELARLYPAQGQLTEEDYLALHTNQLIEFTQGVLEFLEVPTRKHQLIVAALYHKLYQYNLQRDLGGAFRAPADSSGPLNDSRTRCPVPGQGTPLR